MTTPSKESVEMTKLSTDDLSSVSQQTTTDGVRDSQENSLALFFLSAVYLLVCISALMLSFYFMIESASLSSSPGIPYIPGFF